MCNACTGIDQARFHSSIHDRNISLSLYSSCMQALVCTSNLKILESVHPKYIPK